MTLLVPELLDIYAVKKIAAQGSYFVRANNSLSVSYLNDTSYR